MDASKLATIEASRGQLQAMAHEAFSLLDTSELLSIVQDHLERPNVVAERLRISGRLEPIIVLATIPFIDELLRRCELAVMEQ